MRRCRSNARRARRDGRRAATPRLPPRRQRDSALKLSSLNSPPRPSLPPEEGVWKEYVKADGRKWYYNTETRVMQWTVPEPFCKLDEVRDYPRSPEITRVYPRRVAGRPHRSPTRAGPCTLNAVGLLSSRRGVARVAPPCPLPHHLVCGDVYLTFVNFPSLRSPPSPRRRMRRARASRRGGRRIPQYSGRAIPRDRAPPGPFRVSVCRLSSFALAAA